MVPADPDKCLKRLATVVVKIVKFLLGHQAINRFIAVIVSKKTEKGPSQEDLKKEALENLVLKIEIVDRPVSKAEKLDHLKIMSNTML